MINYLDYFLFTLLMDVLNRQTVGATIQVYNNVTGGQWMFMKEISSDGDISTVGLLYEPQWL